MKFTTDEPKLIFEMNCKMGNYHILHRELLFFFLR